MNNDEVFFSISSGANSVKVIPERFTYQDSNNAWDSNWITAYVEIKAGAFSGRYKADFRNIDFASLEKELKYLYNHLDSTATFDPLESYLKIIFKGDGLGHIEVFCEASDNPGWAPNSIDFYMHIDQTYIPQLISQLGLIVKEFPLK